MAGMLMIPIVISDNGDNDFDDDVDACEDVPDTVAFSRVAI